MDVIFDLDGTLIDSAASILASLRAAVNDAGYTPMVPWDVALIGPPLLQTLSIVTGITDQAQLRPLAAAFKAHYDGGGCRLAEPCHGVPEILRGLDGAARLHLATNKRGVPTRLILDGLGWTSSFRSIYSQDRVTPGYADKGAMLKHQLQEQAIDASGAVYVGDTREDGVAAAANGLRFIAVDWGYGRFDGWGAPGPWTRVATASALLDELRRLLVEAAVPRGR